MFNNLSIIIFCALLITQTSESISSTMKINKAVIPAAGLGTRFLPYTKAIPKEMLPLLEIPSIQHIVVEGLGSGITEFYIIANDDKQAIKNHFSPDPALAAKLAKTGKSALLDSVNAIINAAQFAYIPQPEPLGLGHAVLQAKDAIGDEYFGIFLPDEIMIGDIPALAQLIAIAEKYNASVIGVQEVPQEKPPVDQAPSNYALAGRYVLSPRVFASLEVITPGAGGELQLTDGIADMMSKGERVIAYVMNTARYDVGNPLGWIQANIEVGLKHPKYAAVIKELCKKLI
jgi:UTP--glucose-1-phosphate uridylyltransferase